MKDVKYQLELFALYDKDAVEEKMTKMAANGWLVESPGNFLWKYRKIEPQKLQFCVTYFPDASEFDPAPTEGQQLMEEFAAKDGWKIAARFGQMQIFYSEEASPTPIETDAVVQVQNIHRAMKKNMIPTHIFMLILSILQFFFSGWQYATDPIDFLSTPYMLYMVPMWFFIALSAMSELILYYRWYIKARKTAQESGLFLTLHKNHIFSWILLVLSLIMILFIATESSLGSMSTLFYLAVVIIVTLFICGIKLF